MYEHPHQFNIVIDQGGNVKKGGKGNNNNANYVTLFLSRKKNFLYISNLIVILFKFT